MTPRKMATLLLASAGALVVHQLAYLVAHPDNAARQLALSGHAYLGPVASVLVPVALAALVWFSVRSASRALAGQRPSVLQVMLAQTAMFAVQELAERAAAPATIVDEPAVLVGLALQLPVALLLVRLLRAVDRVSAAFCATRPSPSVLFPLAGLASLEPHLLVPRLRRLRLPATLRGPPVGR